MFAQTAAAQAEEQLPSEASLAERIDEARVFWIAAFSALAVSFVALLVHLLVAQFSRTDDGESWVLLVSVFMLIVGVVLGAVCSLRNDVGPLVAWGLKKPTELSTSPETPDAESGEEVSRSPEPSDLKWEELLKPNGGATRIGDAVRWVLANERGKPLAGIGILTDGNSNRGLELRALGELAKQAEVALFPVGVASEQPPSSIRLVDLESPSRVYPGDEFKMTAYVQGYGMRGDSVHLQMTSRPAVTDQDSDDDETATIQEADITLEVGADGEVIAVPIAVRPEEKGKRIYSLKIDSVPKDPDDSDNEISVKVQIVERNSKTLLIAGGPTREYRFLRNMLFRDRDTTVDVLLQTATEGISQEADEILFDFPSEATTLFDYDSIVAFDPDWAEFDGPQLELLEQWVAEKAGGLVVIAGPVFTSTWAENRLAPSQIDIVRQLYPVNFAASRIELGRYGNETERQLEITDDGLSAPFFQLNDVEGTDVRETWNSFSGVYGFYPIRDIKPAAVVLARYSDPQLAPADEAPPLIVSQFYGAGRVLFLGTGEFWRLRALDYGYFERFYTKLLRYVSEGRLLRDSNRGLLLVDKDRALQGDTIGIRAAATDSQFQPLQDETIDVTLRTPDRKTQTIQLGRADGVRDGMYSGRFLAAAQGEYLLEMALPGDGAPVVLEREIRVRLPNLEIERPQLNKADLEVLAQTTAGVYFPVMSDAVSGSPSLAASIPSKRRETYLPGTPDREFQLKLRTWLLGIIAGALSLEWLIRRLNKLA